VQLGEQGHQLCGLLVAGLELLVQEAVEFGVIERERVLHVARLDLPGAVLDLERVELLVFGLQVGLEVAERFSLLCDLQQLVFLALVLHELLAGLLFLSDAFFFILFLADFLL